MGGADARALPAQARDEALDVNAARAGSWEAMVRAREHNRQTMVGFLKRGSRKGMDAWLAFVREKAKQRKRATAALKQLPEGARAPRRSTGGPSTSACAGPRERALKHMLNGALSRVALVDRHGGGARQRAARLHALRGEQPCQGGECVGGVRRAPADDARRAAPAVQPTAEQVLRVVAGGDGGGRRAERRMRAVLAGFGGPSGGRSTRGRATARTCT